MINESTITRYEDAIREADPIYSGLIERYFRIHEQGQRIYLAQQKQGFVPDNLTKEEIDQLKIEPSLRSPYQLKRRDEKGKLYSVDYKEVSPFKSQLPEMARLIDDAARFAMLESLPDAYLIEATLRPQSQALRDGNFERAMLARLNTIYGPTYESYFGLLDRYKDLTFNLHYSFQGLGIKKNQQLTIEIDQIGQEGLDRTSKYLSLRVEVPHRVVAGDIFVFSGLAAESDWGGNTLPSEDRLRNNKGSLSYLNVNVLENRFVRYGRKYTEEHIPELTQSRGWEERAKRAQLINYALHEIVGHGLAMFNEDAEDYLRDKYTPLKELEAELLSFIATITLSSNLADANMKRAVIGGSLAGWMKDIKESNGTYHITAKLLLNSLESKGAITVNEDNWEIRIGDLQKIMEASRDILTVLNHNISTERRFPGEVERFVQIYTENPKTYQINKNSCSLTSN
jgi:hypothetical protein